MNELPFRATERIGEGFSALFSANSATAQDTKNADGSARKGGTGLFSFSLAALAVGTVREAFQGCAGAPPEPFFYWDGKGSAISRREANRRLDSWKRCRSGRTNAGFRHTAIGKKCRKSRA
jgi:hypothetical protein